MIVSAVAVFALVAVITVYLLVRRSSVLTSTRAEFDQTYDGLVAKGEAVEGDREEAWRDFDGWQVTNERERLSWEEGDE
jgi:hypothetical protein